MRRTHRDLSLDSLALFSLLPISMDAQLVWSEPHTPQWEGEPTSILVSSILSLVLVPGGRAQGDSEASVKMQAQRLLLGTRKSKGWIDWDWIISPTSTGTFFSTLAE